MRSARADWLPGLAVCLALGGCISSQGRLYVATVAPGTEQTGGLTDLGTPVRREVVGRDTRITSVLFVPTFDGPRLERALADALEKGGGETLHGLRTRTIEFWLLVGWSVLEVRGDIVEPSAAEASR
jgi:hypothetical protein